MECVTIKFLDNKQLEILRTLPNYSPCFMSRGNVIHLSLCHQDEEDDELGQNVHPVLGSILRP